jgi:23S rRNA (guanosine2251-2'-O)-methyltransferase
MRGSFLFYKQICARVKSMKQKNILIMHNIRSVENVGAMFRTADAAGVDKIYLTGYTPTPLDRFGRKRGDLAKSALGAEEFVRWEQKKTILSLLTKLKQDKFLIIAIEQDEKSIDYKKIKLQNKNAFIVGAEVTGIPKNILKLCDVIAEIPMSGKKESLNVSVSLGVALFRMLKI